MSSKDIKKTLDIVTSQNKQISQYPIGHSDKPEVKCHIKLNSKSNVDSSTFDPMKDYAHQIEKCKNKIIQLLQRHPLLTFEQIHSKLTTKVYFPVEVIYLSINTLLKNKTIIYFSNKYRLEKISKENQSKGSIILEQPTVNKQITPTSEQVNVKAVFFDSVRRYGLEYVIDRLSKAEFIELGDLMASGDFDLNKDFKKSLMDSNMLLEDPQTKSLFLVLPHDGLNTIYRFHRNSKNSKFDKASDLELKESKHFLEPLATPLVGELKDYKAYLLTSEDGSVKFKLLDPNKNSYGYICDQTAQLTKEKLKDLISDEKIQEIKKLNKGVLPGKKVLCNVYEQEIRKMTPNEIARPHIANALLTKASINKKK
jgi:hypothetical protein